MGMNRLVIIGNGFDLAHGLETSYTQFINYFWEQEKEKVLSTYDPRSQTYEYDNSEFYKIKIGSPFTIKTATCTTIKKCIDNPDEMRKDITHIGYKWFIYVSRYQKNTIFQIKNAFLGTISEMEQSQNWVDIEEEYYRQLKLCLDGRRNGGVKKLNDEFEKIKVALKSYLKDLPKQQAYSINKNVPYLDKSIPVITGEDPIDNMLFLNFNYTRVINRYAGHHTPVIHIHGDLEAPENPIIFGYGDESDEYHKLLERNGNDEYLKYIKSIEYLKTTNYKRLRAFVEADKYEIFIVGHSCGISDQTLLNYLFEHKHCLRIKVFYYKKEDGTDDYTDHLYNIYRIFDDKTAMRGKVFKAECI